jgi:hypothetical protein
MVCARGKFGGEKYCVRMHTLNLALRGVHTHSNGARGVHSIAKHRGVWLVHAQYEYKLSRDSVINGARRLLCTVGAY